MILQVQIEPTLGAVFVAQDHVVFDFRTQVFVQAHPSRSAETAQALAESRWVAQVEGVRGAVEDHRLALDARFVGDRAQVGAVVLIAAAVFEITLKFMITYRDTLLSNAVHRFIEALPAQHIRTAFRSPWQNAFAERVIGSFRRKCFDHVIPLGPDHVERLAKQYIAYYHQDRAHQGLHGKTPFGREAEPFTPQLKNVIALPRCNGLHHRYVLKKTA